ncbi:MAG: metallophosphoesterase family protein [Solirubrobacteraceae bacterium]
MAVSTRWTVARRRIRRIDHEHGAGPAGQRIVRVAVISDVHGNLQALEAVLADVRDAGLESLWCLGDTVGYGADPDACVELVREHAEVCLAGNHDLAVTGSLSTESFSDAARLAAEWTRGTIKPEHLAFLETLVPANQDHGVSLFHGSPRDPVWEYVLAPQQAERGFSVQRHRVCVVGHTHVALHFHRLDGGSTRGETNHCDDRLKLGSGDWLVNPGSVGQPRDGDSRAAWLELDTDSWTIRFRRTPYDIERAQAAIRMAGLSESLAERLSYGQ